MGQSVPFYNFQGILTQNKSSLNFMQDVRLSYCSDGEPQCTDRTSGQDSHAPRTAHKNRLHAAFQNYPGAIRKTSSGIGEKMIYFVIKFLNLSKRHSDP